MSKVNQTCSIIIEHSVTSYSHIDFDLSVLILAEQKVQFLGR